MSYAFESNAARIAAIYRARRARWTAALARGMRKALVAVERAAVRLLSGGGAPWSYPVPVRTGNLRRHMGFELPAPTVGYVFNTARYAFAIHSGTHLPPSWRKRKPIAREFLYDAVKEADPTLVVHGELVAAL